MLNNIEKVYKLSKNNKYNILLKLEMIINENTCFKIRS